MSGVASILTLIGKQQRIPTTGIPVHGCAVPFLEGMDAMLGDALNA